MEQSKKSLCCVSRDEPENPHVCNEIGFGSLQDEKVDYQSKISYETHDYFYLSKCHKQKIKIRFVNCHMLEQIS